MDNVVVEIQNWLNNTYKGKKNYIPFAEEEIDGIAGVSTFKRLVRALQIELNECYSANLVVDGDFGKGTLKALPASIIEGFRKGNIVKVIQCALYCKGYDTRPLDNDFGKIVTRAVRSFQSDAGIAEDGVIQPIILQGIMNSDAYKYKGLPSGLNYHQHRVQKTLNRLYGMEFGLIAPSGLWERTSQKMLIKACQKSWGSASVDGVWGTETQGRARMLKKGSSYTLDVKLLQMALAINGHYSGEFNGAFDEKLEKVVYDFQDFMQIGADGIAGKGTWASLLTSKGNTNRASKAIDTATRLDVEKLTALKKLGYTTVGRYLTNASETGLDKKITRAELVAFKETGMKIVPIFQTYGSSEAYFLTKNRGRYDAKTAKIAAGKLGFPRTTTIYFAVDYDVTMKSVEEVIVPYFKALKKEMNGSYQIGVYGSRAVCNALEKEKLTTSSYVSDMSSGYTGNIGQIMPSNWAYDQFVETTAAGIGIDKVAVSTRATGVVPDVANTGDTDENNQNMEGESFLDIAYKIKPLIVKIETGVNTVNPYAKMASDFDGMRLSLGICQFNIGQKTLQEILERMDTYYRKEMKNALGNFYEEVMHIEELDKSVLDLYMTEGTPRNEAMNSLCSTEMFRNIQDDYFEAYMYQAAKRCNIERYNFKTARSFAVMLDTAIHHGALIDSSVNELYDANIHTIDSSNEKERLKLFIDCITATVTSFQDDFRERCYYLYDESTNPHGVKTYLSPISNFGVTDEMIYDMPTSDAAESKIIELIDHSFLHGN